jgi:hypothetical protein
MNLSFAIAAQLLRWVRILAALLFIFSVSSGAGHAAERVRLFPKLYAGQILNYQISYTSDKQTKTESAVTLSSPPGPVHVQAAGLLRLEVLGVKTEAARSQASIRTTVESLDHDTASQDSSAGAPSQPATAAPATRTVDFTISSDGRVEQIVGLGTLSPEDQEVWRDWLAQFALAATFPEKGVSIGEKWKAEEPIANAALAALVWEKESEYVQDEPCPVDSNGVTIDSTAAAPSETCAVILTRANLKQKSSPKDATPEDFRARMLRTEGSARGANQVISYISLKTALPVRVTEEANQSMDVTVAKVDASNRVHYTVEAKSRSQMLIVPVDPAAHP